MNRSLILCSPLLAGLLLSCALVGQEAEAPAQPTTADQLAKAKVRAAVHNTRVLVAFVHDDDATALLQRTLTKDRAVRRLVQYEYEVVQVVADAAPELATKLGMAGLVADKPGVAILEPQGEVVARLAWSDLANEADGDGMGPFAAQLDKHKPAPVDAEIKLKSALAEAKKSGRAVFIRFDAPW